MPVITLAERRALKLANKLAALQDLRAALTNYARDAAGHFARPAILSTRILVKLLAPAMASFKSAIDPPPNAR